MSFDAIDTRKFAKRFDLIKLGRNQFITNSQGIISRAEFTEGFHFNPIDLMYLMNRSSYYFSHYFRHLFAINKIRTSNSTVVDLGCGTAFVRDLIHRSTYIGRTQYIGIDADYPSLARASQTLYGRFLLINDHLIGDTPYIKDHSVDLVIAMEIYEHMDELQGDAFIAGIHRMLRTGGRLVLSTPNSDNMHRDFHIKEYTIEEVKEKLSQFFEIEDVLGWDSFGGGHHVEKSFSKRDRMVFQGLSRYIRPAVLRRIFLGMYPELASASIYSCIKR